MKNILFVDVENTCLSQMAEAITNNLAEMLHMQVKAKSAGFAPGFALDGNALAVLAEWNVPMYNVTPKGITQYMVDEADYVVFVGTDVEHHPSPVQIRKKQVWLIESPEGEEELDKPREIRDQLKSRIMALIDTMGSRYE